MSEKVAIFFLFVAALGGMIGAYWWMNEIPFNKAREDMQGQIDQLKRKIDSYPEVTVQIGEAQEQYKKLQDEFRQLSTRIQKEPQIPEIVRQTQKYSEECKVDFTEIRFDNLREYEDYDELPMEFVATGPYHAIGRFIARMENLRLVNARAGQISLTPTGASTDRTRRRAGEEEVTEIQLQMTATSYIFKGGIGSMSDVSY